MHMSLYRLYRPRSFSDVIGQDAAVHVIRSAIARKQVGHAYLFSGPRGSGKTSLARLLAKAVNCSALTPEGEPCGSCDNCTAISRGEHLDVIEIDGASNNGVDEVRELKAKVSLAPFSGSRKVYIIDEVHMLSGAAFNALLKTLEEPPEHVIFLLATTEPHKVPVTIRSRCQHIPFHRISVPHIRQRLQAVCQSEKIRVTDEALWELARQADGALRDALSLLEQAATLAEGELTMESIRQMLGGGTRPEVERWLVLLREGSTEAHRALKAMIDSGVSPERLLDQVFLLLRDLWAVCRWGMESVSGLDLSDQEKAFLAEQAPLWAESDLSAAMDFCLRLFGRVRLGIRGDVFVGALCAGLLAKPEPQKVPAGPERLRERTSRQPERSVEVKNTSPTTKNDLPSKPALQAPPRFSPPSSPGPVEVAPPSGETDRRSSDRQALVTSGGVTFGEDPQGAWKSLIDDLKEQDLPLFAVLSKCEAELVGGQTLRLTFPVGEPFLEDLLSQERHAWRLARLCEARDVAGPVLTVFGDREIPLSASPGDVPPEESSKGGALFKIPERLPGAAGKKGGDAAGDGAEDADAPRRESGVEKDVARVRRWFSAEVLLVKQNQAGEEPDCGESIEEGAPEE